MPEQPIEPLSPFRFAIAMSQTDDEQLIESMALASSKLDEGLAELSDDERAGVEEQLQGLNDTALELVDRHGTEGLFAWARLTPLALAAQGESTTAMSFILAIAHRAWKTTLN